jgi:hypothetical protein
MDFVYICRDGPNNELKYSIRSVYKNAPVNSLWVVGGRPGWYSGKYINVEQNHETKYLNAQANLRSIINNPYIPDKFILMNDDFYITQPIFKIPVYHGGSLEKKAEAYLNFKAKARHAQMLMETANLLKQNGVSTPLDYSLHLPMTMHKENLEHSVNMGGAIRSVYGNLNRIGGTRLPVHDVKVHGKDLIFPESFDYIKNEHQLPFLSSSDYTFNQLYRNTLKQFSEPSPEENRFS